MKKKKKISKKLTSIVLALTMLLSTITTSTPIQASETYNVPVGFMNYQNGVDYGTIEDISYYSDATESTRKAKVLLPSGYTEEKEYPVMYLLHGIGGDETSLYNDKVEYVIGNAIDDGAAEEMIVVLPNVCANADGRAPEVFFSLEHYQAYDNFLYDLTENLMPYIEDNYPVKTGRENTAIAGFSMGGRTALYIGFTCPELFGYIGGFCPAPGILPYTHYGVTEEGHFTESTFTLPEMYMNNTFVEVMAGTNDTIVVDFPESYHNALEGNGVPHIWYKTAGGDAVSTGDGGHSAPTYKHGLYQFLDQAFVPVISGGQTETPVVLPYEDVEEGIWYYDAVEYNYFEGIMTGKADTIFAPEENLARAQFASVLHRISGAPSVAFAQEFPDVEEGIWYTAPILWAKSKKVINGYQNGNFGPGDNITREQMAVMMHNYAAAKGYDVMETADLGGYVDADEISPYALEAMRWAVGAGIISGKSNGTLLDPQGPTARAQCAVIIYNFITAYEK